jgi:hypothetical protein
VSHLTPADTRLLEQLNELLEELLVFVPRAINRLWAGELSPVDREHVERLVRSMVERQSGV